MKTIRIYQAGTYSVGEMLTLSSEATQHVAVVLRLREGDEIRLFRGDNQEYVASLVKVQKREVVVRLDAVQTVSRESPCTIHLAQGVSKGERMEWVIQKAVELGVTSITPVLTARSVVRLDSVRTTKKEAQWQSIAIHACEQCGRNQVPIVHPICSLEDFIQKNKMPFKWVLDPKANKTIKDYPAIASKLALLIGPEGGLTAEELQVATEAHYQPLSLGPRILRTETAALTALSILQARYGDL